VQAVILAGGLGSRLSKIHPNVPKAMVPVAGRPFLQTQTEWLSCRGITTIHLALGYMADAVLGWLRNYRPPGVEITTSTEPEPMGTAGGLKFAEPFMRSDPFLAVNGDTLLPNLDPRSMRKSHDKSGARVSMAVTQIQDAGRFGSVEFNGRGKVISFHEKANRAKGWINGGVYMIDRSLVSALEEATSLSLENDVFPSLARDGLLGAVPTPPPLLDMGTPGGLKIMQSYLERERAI